MERPKHRAAPAPPGGTRKRSQLDHVPEDEDTADGDTRPALTKGMSKGYDVSFCLSLLPLFDFQQQGRVTREDWRKGAGMMMLEEMGDDEPLWQLLLSKFDPHGTGAVPMDVIQDLVPVDPRMLVMFRSMVTAVSGLSDKLAATQRKLGAQGRVRADRVILDMRRESRQRRRDSSPQRPRPASHSRAAVAEAIASS